MALTAWNALDTMKKETGLVYVKVLEHAGVYPRKGQVRFPAVSGHSVNSGDHCYRRFGGDRQQDRLSSRDRRGLE